MDFHKLVHRKPEESKPAFEEIPPMKSTPEVPEKLLAQKVGRIHGSRVYFKGKLPLNKLGGFKNFVLSWILPKDEETLRTWLLVIELFDIVLSIFALLLVVLTLIATDLLWTIKFGVMLIVMIIGLSTLNLMQYLLQIEFNTRGYILKRRR
jgi:hypothetical protein